MSISIRNVTNPNGLLYGGLLGDGLVPFIDVPASQIAIGHLTNRNVNLGRDVNPDKVSVIRKTSTFTTAEMADSCRVINMNVLRNPKGDPNEGLQINEGYGRHQHKGFGYREEHPLNTRILVRRDNFFSTRQTKLGTPQ